MVGWGESCEGSKVGWRIVRPVEHYPGGKTAAQHDGGLFGVPRVARNSHVARAGRCCFVSVVWMFERYQ